MFGPETSCVELIVHDQPADDERNDALSELAAGTGRARRSRRATCTTPRPRDAQLAQALAAIRARSSLDEMDGWLAARRRRATCGPATEMAAPPEPLPRRPRAHRGAGRGLRVRLPRDRAPAAGLPRPRRQHRGDLAARAWSPEKAAGPLRPAARRARRRRLRADRPRAGRHRRARLPRLLPDRARHRAVLRGRAASCARAAARPPTRPSATRWGSPASTRSSTACCSSGSCPRAATGRPTSTWTSSTGAARRSSSTSTASTAGTGPRRSPT